MLPIEVANALVDSGICYQVEITDLVEKQMMESLGLIVEDEEKDEFSNIGYNVEKENADKKSKEKLKIEVITDAKKLKASNGWNLAAKPPKTLTTDDYPKMLVSAKVVKHKLIIFCDDIPWSPAALKYVFSLEYIDSIKYAANLNTLIITTKFGQTGIKLA